jgi:nucleotide-binding universal stress UspA family protein
VSQALRPVQVVVAYDFSPSAEQALARAIEVAIRAPQHVLHIIHVLGETGRHITYEQADAARDRIVSHITDAFGGRTAPGAVHFFVHTVIGKPADEILDLAREVGADLIFVGSHGKTGVERFVLGSISERIVREAHCPVMVARPKTYHDVALLDVVADDHPHHAYKEPHRYVYVENRVITRPDAWPLS